MTGVIKQTLLTEKALCMLLLGSCVSLFGLYMYLVSASVVHVVMRTETNQEISHISSDISSLESIYIKSQHRVSSDIATLQGFQKVSDKVFIDKSVDSLVLSTDIGR